MTERDTISDEKFMILVDLMLANGGDWKVSMAKEGTWLTYENEQYRISEKHAEAMFRCIPRKCCANPKQTKETP